MTEDRPAIIVKTFPAASAQLTLQDRRIANIEAVSIPAQKIWKWGKLIAPIGIGLIIASAGATSPLGKVAIAVRDTMAVAAQ